ATSCRKAAQRRSQIARRPQAVRAILPRRPTMFEKILIANRGDQLPQGSAAAKPNRSAAAGRQGDFAAETHHV
ncbi:MAG: 3-methylcrotonyl-CoA carboxylase, partial [Pseudomonadota bacterium]